MTTFILVGLVAFAAGISAGDYLNRWSLRERHLCPTCKRPARMEGDAA